MRNFWKREAKDAGKCGGWCIGCILIIAFNLTIGAMLFDYCLWAYFGKDIEWYWDVLGGLFLAEFCLPAAAIGWLLTTSGAFPLPIFK